MSEPGAQQVIWGRFKILRALGQGAQGRTFLAWDPEEKQEIVLKELSLLRAVDWKSVELFEREGLALKTLKHPSIPGFVETFHLGDRARFFLVQEFIAGENLQAKIERLELMDEAMARALLEEMLDVLEYLHGLSPPVVHRDIKPSNIMRRADRTHVLIDFGAVQALVYDDVGGSTIVGTTGYMAPEQLVGRACAASDLYALAATVVHCVVGIHPTDLPMVRMRLQFREIAKLSPVLSDVLERMLDPSMRSRFQSATEVRAALAGGQLARLAKDESRQMEVVRESGKYFVGISKTVQGLLLNSPVKYPQSVIYADDEQLMITIPGTYENKTVQRTYTVLAFSLFLLVISYLFQNGEFFCFSLPIILVCFPVLIFFISKKAIVVDSLLTLSKNGVELVDVKRNQWTNTKVHLNRKVIPFDELHNIDVNGSLVRNKLLLSGIGFTMFSGEVHTLELEGGDISKLKEIAWLKEVIVSHVSVLRGIDSGDC